MFEPPLVMTHLQVILHSLGLEPMQSPLPLSLMQLHAPIAAQAAVMKPKASGRPAMLRTTMLATTPSPLH